eukprot:g12677.t1
MSTLDPAFQGVGKAPGLTLWRIEKKQVVKQPVADGKFHEGDCYILLATTATPGRHSQSTHFWLGSECTQDEMGIAAYKTVELDDSLGGAAVQYRETQGHESPLFLSYFKSTGVEYLPGGVDSGFNKMEKDVFRTRLLHVKGKRVVRVSEVPCSTDSLNTGDVFILDAGLKLYLWSGENANMYEKSKGVQTMQRIKDTDRAGRATMTFLDDNPKNAEFWDNLGGYAEITAEGEPDEVVERVSSDSIKLYQVSDESGTMTTEEVVPSNGGGLTADLMNPNDVYILDVGSEIFVWVGRGSTVEEKKSGMPYAAKFIEENGRDVAAPVSRLAQGYETTSFKGGGDGASATPRRATPITRLAQGYETAVFKGYFQKWNPQPVPSWEDTPASSKSPGLSAPAAATSEADSAALAQGMLASSSAMDEKPVDDGSGQLEVWRVENFKLAPWPKEKYGQFYGGDCYVMLYTYLVGGRESYLIYFWQGRESTQDEIGASALLAKDMDDKLNDAAVQVRVVMGKEPKHMRNLFKGHLVIHSGGVASGFKNSTEGDTYDTDGVCLFHVKGTQPDNTYGVQVPEVASSLNSGDAFVLLTPTDIYLWVGNGCSPEETKAADEISKMLLDHGDVSGRTRSTVKEGSEPEGFWNALGGMGEYPKVSEAEEVSQEPRLFQVSNATGKLTVTPVCNFDQTDLCADDVMLLDTVTSVFVWVGPQANETERRESMNVAQEYINTASDGRSPDTPVLQVAAGNEPPLFTQHFRGWDPLLTDKNKFVDPYQAKLAAAREEEAKMEAKLAEAPGTITMDDLPPAPANGAANGGGGGGGTASRDVVPPSAGRTVPYADLKGYGNELQGVDPSCREQYLDDKEFVEVFGMSKSEFASQPKWKQVSQKKAKELF